MYNKKLRIKFSIMGFIMFFLCVLLFFPIEGINNFLNYYNYKSVEKSLDMKTEAYKQRIEMQLESDIQLLNTSSTYLADINNNNYEDIFNIFHESNKKNHFMIMLAIYKDGKGIESIINEKEIRYIDINSMEPELIKIYKESLNSGSTLISDVFYSEYIQDDVVAIASPICIEENNIDGVLIGYDTVDQFNSNLNISIKSDGQVDYVNMIESNGNFIARSRYKLDKKESSSIYNMGLNLLDEDEVKLALSNGKDYYSTFTLDGINYGVYFKHFDYKDWYIYSINYTKDEVKYMSKVVFFTRIIGLSIIIIIVLFVVISYFMLKKHNKELTKLAYYDNLTGAYDSKYFREICQYILKTHKNYSIVILNIKKFKIINEIFGENLSNEFLCHIKDTLQKNKSEGEWYCRDISDQFIILVKSVNKDKILKRINKIKREIGEFAKIKNQNYFIEIYGGICPYIEEKSTDISYKTMYENALFAMKQFRKSDEEFIFYDESIGKDMNTHRFIEANKQKALDNYEFKLFLQPKIDLKTKKVISAEALVRWIRPDGTIIYPNDFIPIFEQNGFCEKLDIYMIEQVCKKLKDWMEIGVDKISISINQSKLLFYKSDYLERICCITKKYGISNSRITLEILEDLTIDNLEQFNINIANLHSKGFKVSMDDFGSGYSSLNTLSNLKIDELKIDKDFLLKIKENDENHDRQKQILKSIICLAKELNIETVIEGVENKQHLDIIIDLGCDIAQGYYFSKPLAVEEFEDKYIN